MTSPLRIRNSEIACFRECRRKWYNSFVLNLTNEATPDQQFSRPPGTNATGTFCHTLLEAHYCGEDTFALIGALRDEVRECAPEETVDEWLESLALAEIMFDGYRNWATDEGLDQGEETLHTEHDLEWGIFPDVFVTGKIDRIVQDTTWDRTIIEDYKTVQTLEKGPQFQVDTQLLTYVLLANKNGIITNDARHTMLRRVKRSARAKPPFYARAEVTFNDEQLVAHERALRATVEDILEVRTYDGRPWDHDQCRNYAYPNPTKDCSWKCPFVQICAAHDDGSDIDGLRAELFTVREEVLA